MTATAPVLAVAAPLQGATGFLYPPNDYAAAARLVGALAANPALRQAVGQAARGEVEKFGWSAATKTLREQQYSRAIRMSNGRRR